ncbi:MAG: tRNA (N(6)-L-threonylcarbamoyladenosine(37)-C(2))-methylthiotransferase MtaB [Oscillospiraceae bacterium]|nr:tRNA (N(6)-L-threonylcarbamoyladenosine(37)-C(2))-methylthiotransferase MtaB [Oscillospiraceae bacterium]
MKFFIETFGCKVNFYESAALQKLFLSKGFTAADSLSDADVVVINCCTVTGNADRKDRAFFNRVKRENPRAAVVLTGCWPQAYPEAAGKLGADIVTGNGNRSAIPDLVLSYLRDRQPVVDILDVSKAAFECLEADELHEHNRAFLKIEDGCEKYCTYCAIPKARGKVRSMPLADITRQSLSFAEKGYHEIVLAGINLAAYGSDTGCDLGDAVIAAAEPESVIRVRLSSLECDIITDEMLDKFASCNKFCPQFHLSLQSGCDRTLKRMNRHYTAGQYREACDRIRERFDSPTFTTDIICGFPGETEEDFLESLEFCRSIGFLRTHIFPYSKRSGTMAYSMPGQLTRAEKQSRASRMKKALDPISRSVMESFVGKKVRVILEQQLPDGSFSGYTDRYIPAKVTAEGSCRNDIVIGTVSSVEKGYALIEADNKQ